MSLCQFALSARQVKSCAQLFENLGGASQMELALASSRVPSDFVMCPPLLVRHGEFLRCRQTPSPCYPCAGGFAFKPIS